MHTIQSIRNIADDYKKSSRWATVRVYNKDGQPENVNLRIITIGRTSIKLMHANGHTRIVKPEECQNVW